MNTSRQDERRTRQRHAPALVIGASIFACLVAWWTLSSYIGLSKSNPTIAISDLSALRSGGIAAVEGMVTFVNVREKKFYFQDGAAALGLALPEQPAVHVGDRVSVLGTVTRAAGEARGSDAISLTNTTGVCAATGFLPAHTITFVGV